MTIMIPQWNRSWIRR